MHQTRTTVLTEVGEITESCDGNLQNMYKLQPKDALSGLHLTVASEKVSTKAMLFTFGNMFTYQNPLFNLYVTSMFHTSKIEG